MSIESRGLQDREIFEKRRRRYRRFGAYAAFALASVQGSMEKILALGEEGTQVIATRTGDYRPWDPETIRVDEVAEGYFLERIRESGFDAIVISEEVGRTVSQKTGKDKNEKGRERVYIVSDPFNGSLLYKRHLPEFWYTTLAIYSDKGIPLTAAICDICNQSVDFANQEDAFSARFQEGKLADIIEIRPARTPGLLEAVLETYLMKPPRMYPASEIWEPLLSKVRFILPNGGPAGYADVAKGNVDIYLALEEAHIENFSALPIAWRAGAIVSDFNGAPIRFEDKKDKRYFILCSATESLHEQVLREIEKIGWKEHPHYRQILKENVAPHEG